jgi:hypothetical protein
MDLAKLIEIAVFVYGVLALVVKVFPTVPAKYPWLLEIIKFLGNVTNRQTDDAAIRAKEGTDGGAV